MRKSLFTASALNEFAQLLKVYSSMLIEEQTETLVYDVVNMLSSVGGNLGLFLGLSCFSCLMYLLEFTFATAAKHIHNK